MSKTLRGHRWTGWSARRPSLLRPFPVLRVEELEERATPASFTWSGAGGNANWSNAANWQGGSAPTGNPLALDALSFPSGVSVAAHNTINNLNNATFFSISISDPNYTIAGKSITLGSAAASGSISSSSTNGIVSLDIALGAVAGSKQFFTVGAGGDLTLSGKISGNTGSIFTKDGNGILVLSNDNSNFTGPIQVADTGGVLRITNSKALGDSVGETTVGTNSTLQVSNVAGSINEPLRLNGPGVSNLGALRSFAGANTWSGTVILDSDATFGAAVGTSVNLTGQISDTGTSRNVTKEDFGEVRFSGSNTYRGSTTINNGILTAADANALGTADKTTATGTVVNETLSKAGQLQIAGPAGSGFTILNEALVLNGDGLVSSTTNAGSQIPYGFDNYGKGAFYNSTGNNTWAGPVTLGSLGKTSTNYAALGAADGTDIIVSGIVTGGAGFLLEKVEPGRVILNNVNTYKGNTRVYEGILNIRDSGALGAVTATTGLVDVVDGGTLELEVEAATTTPRFGYDQATGNSTGRDLWNDSVTLDPNALTLSNPITINGRGFQNTGALRSRSGINTVTVDVNLDRLAFPFALTGDGSDASIGVDQDLRPGHPSPNSNYFTSDYSLTILGQITGGTYTEFVKRGAGHLILPGANTYQGVTQIEQGWVTIEDNNALGVDIVGLGDTVQPEVYVLTGAALHLKAPSAGAPLDIKKNITIGGTGPTHNYSLINQGRAGEYRRGQHLVRRYRTACGHRHRRGTDLRRAPQRTHRHWLHPRFDQHPNLHRRRRREGAGVLDRHGNHGHDLCDQLELYASRQPAGADRRPAHRLLSPSVHGRPGHADLQHGLRVRRRFQEPDVRPRFEYDRGIRDERKPAGWRSLLPVHDHDCLAHRGG